MVILAILIRARAGTLWNTCELVEKVDGVTRAHVVTGPYDIIAYADIPSLENLKELIKRIHEVEGVLHTGTCITM
ncbi:MAG: Lrp/AsnC ligand binding domain-containing protein [Candidatus Thorarchaeota archaeon]|nr:MAG: Lrp/AsnC ligand binding domain-containing protein [Candidatus Thorarchaeota archaeon]